MFLNDDEANARVSSLDNLINKLELRKGVDLRKLHNGGRPKGRHNDSTEQRANIAQHALVHGPSETAREFNTTPSRASLLSDGIVTHGLGRDDELMPVVQDKKQEAHNKALDILTKSLGLVEGKIDKDMNPKALTEIAANMARIIEKTGPKNAQDDNKPKVNVVIYAPRVRDENEYEVIEVAS